MADATASEATQIRRYLSWLGISQKRLATLLLMDPAFVRAICRGAAAAPEWLLPWLKQVWDSASSLPPVPDLPANHPVNAGIAMIWAPSISSK